MLRVRDGQGGWCVATRPICGVSSGLRGGSIGPVVGFVPDTPDRETGAWPGRWRGLHGHLPMVSRQATGPLTHNCRFARHDGTLRVAAMLRGIAALLHFVATGKNGSGKAFDGQ
jgi:hypothetical protein